MLYIRHPQRSREYRSSTIPGYWDIQATSFFSIRYEYDFQQKLKLCSLSELFGNAVYLKRGKQDVLRTNVTFVFTVLQQFLKHSATKKLLWFLKHPARCVSNQKEIITKEFCPKYF